MKKRISEIMENNTFKNIEILVQIKKLMDFFKFSVNIKNEIIKFSIYYVNRNKNLIIRFYEIHLYSHLIHCKKLKHLKPKIEYYYKYYTLADLL